MKKLNTFYVVVFLFLIVFSSTRCATEGVNRNVGHGVVSKDLSYNNPHLQTCIFNSAARIVHFPTYHVPLDWKTTTKDRAETYDLVTKSQFQLLHTLLAYNRSRFVNLHVFDEGIINDLFDSQHFKDLSQGRVSSTYKRSDGEIFILENEYRKAHQLFSRFIPGYYEQLSHPQKQFLFDLGASFTLYFLGEISKLHQVIDRGTFNLVKNQMRDANSRIVTQGNEHLTHNFREEELRKQVDAFYRQNYSANMLILIAYGGSHDFSDEFRGYPFQSGRDFCLKWVNFRDPRVAFLTFPFSFTSLKL